VTKVSGVSGAYVVPAAEPGYFLALANIGAYDKVSDRLETGQVGVYNDDRRMLFTLSGLDELKTSSKLPWEKRIHYYPRAGLLVTIGADQDRLILRRVKLLDELEKSGADYLVVLSQPPAAKVGTIFFYKLDIHAKKGGVKVSLESGPGGLRVKPNGQVMWIVPANFEASEADVIVSLRDASGQEVFHTFPVKVTNSHGFAASPAPAGAAAHGAVTSPVPQPPAAPPIPRSFVGPDGKWKLPPGAPDPAVAPFNEATAKQHQERWAKFLDVAVVQTNSIGMKLTLIPPGEFEMGSPKELIDEELRLNGGDDWYKSRLPGEAPGHRVRITKPCWLGVTDVTQEEYQRVIASNPSEFPGDPKRPVEQVSWDDTVEFCRKLSELPAEKAAKRRYALPTEAQWEYACRAGSTGRWCFSAQPNPLPAAAEEKLLGDYAWFGTNAGSQTHPVGQKRANAWGLYDMYGNVWQWCQDWYDKDYYGKSAANDPTGPAEGSRRIHRGGSWMDDAANCRSAVRCSFTPGDRGANVGFRVALVPAEHGG
jgi:formylglycine-generating enzyme required for sulfatase activity